MGIRSTTLDEVGDIHAPPGSRPWAVAIRLELQHSLGKYEFDHDIVKRLLSLVAEHNGYKSLEDRRGRPFRSFESFCVEPRPWGLGYSRQAIDRLKSDLGPKTAQQQAHEPRTLLDDPGPATKEERKSNPDVIRNSLGDIGGTSAAYLTARIARDRPDILERMKAGEFKSVRAAAIEAGIVKVPTPYEQTAKLLAKLSKPERKRLYEALAEEFGDA